MRPVPQPPLRRFAAIGVAAALAAGLTSFAPSASAQPNTAPDIIPSLQTWTGGEGRFDIAPAARIVTDDAELDDVAGQFADDLEAATGLNLSVVDGAPQPGDLVLDLDETLDHEAGGDNFLNEGYLLDVGADRATISAPSATGVFYGTRTLLQGLVQSPGRSSFPVGMTTDWPSYETRGFMLDVGRRFFTPEFIRDYIQMMSWYKLNEFQIHLNDNQIPRPATGWQDGYSGFRLKSDNPEFADLASEDGAYDRADWQSFEDLASGHSVQIVPEIDVPAHSLAFIQWRPELGLNGGDSDHLDLTKPATTETIKDIFDEFVPWFEGPEVHYGADEYPREHADAYRTFFNDMAEHVRSLGKHPRAWGSMSVMHGSADGYDKDVTINAWNDGWYGMASALADGYEFINTNDSTLYVVPFANYYHGQGLNNQGLYSSWLPNRLWNTDTVPAGAPQGAMFAVWNDLVDADYTELDVHGLVRESFPVIAQKTWRAAAPTPSYAEFAEVRDTVAAGPGLTLIDEPQRAQGDLAADASVTADSATSNNPADNLLDGRQYTRWQSEGDDASFTLDLGAPSTVGEVAVEWAQPLPASFDVELSYDGAAWLTAASGVSGEEGSTTVDPTLARYVRVTAEGEDIGAWSVSVFGPPALTDGATATASGNEAPNLDASQAVDGNLTTRWSANYVDRPWLAVDLGEAKTFSQLELVWEAASATGYVVEVSDDGSSWDEVASRTGMADGARTDLIEFDEVTASHVRVTVTAKSLTPYLSLYELIIPAPEVPAPAALTIEDPADAVAKVGETVSIELSASGTGPLTWSATGLPDGLALDADTGIISGAPMSPGNSTVEVTVTDAAGYRVSATMQLTVEAATPTTPPVTPPVTTPPATPPAGPEFVRTAPYTIPGKHFVNGRDWHTTCEPYSQTERCLTEIWASVVKRTGNTFTIERGWAFNNLTYLPFMKREQWSANPLGYAGSWTASDGTLWRTECDTALTGGSACRSFRWTTVYEAEPKAGGGYTFGQDNTWVFNNLVMFGAYSR